MDSIIKTETFFRNSGSEVLRMDITTYDISYLAHPNCVYGYTQDVFQRLYDHLIQHVMQSKYKDKVVYFVVYFKNNKIENSPSRLELFLVWNGELDRNKIFNYLFIKIFIMERVPMIEFVKDLDMVIISMDDGYMNF